MLHRSHAQITPPAAATWRRRSSQITTGSVGSSSDGSTYTSKGITGRKINRSGAGAWTWTSISPRPHAYRSTDWSLEAYRARSKSPPLSISFRADGFRWRMVGRWP